MRTGRFTLLLFLSDQHADQNESRAQKQTNYNRENDYQSLKERTNSILARLFAVVRFAVIRFFAVIRLCC
jgi:hypothetical protein